MSACNRPTCDPTCDPEHGTYPGSALKLHEVALGLLRGRTHPPARRLGDVNLLLVAAPATARDSLRPERVTCLGKGRAAAPVYRPSVSAPVTAGASPSTCPGAPAVNLCAGSFCVRNCTANLGAEEQVHCCCIFFSAQTTQRLYTTSCDFLLGRQRADLFQDRAWWRPPPLFCTSSSNSACQPRREARNLT